LGTLDEKFLTDVKTGHCLLHEYFPTEIVTNVLVKHTETNVYVKNANLFHFLDACSDFWQLNIPTEFSKTEKPFWFMHDAIRFD
jgi:hypothetical protein